MTSKYHNRKVKTSDGTFDSQKEYRRWCELKLLLRAGEIKELERQVKFELIPKQDGEKAIHYVADFVYIDNRTGQRLSRTQREQRPMFTSSNAS